MHPSFYQASIIVLFCLVSLVIIWFSMDEKQKE
ncbi:hypothetical protein J2S02_004830 [Metabacillus niabensis]|uniref:Uncharacterized protein n=1 Tax=Metabacillus niabensis TaxID=324854 RepID=A0ABT9Z861_9BACI|nr:hypothetical protein [Metabacillus niabensis]